LDALKEKACPHARSARWKESEDLGLDEKEDQKKGCMNAKRKKPA